MKKIFAILLAALLLLSLAACGKTVEEEPKVEIIAPAPVEETKEPETPAEPEVPEETAAPAAEPAFDEAMFQAAEALKGESVEELFDAIGEPDSIEEYMSSCMGPGEDGLFHYPGFDVYTYREGDSEIVYDVLEA